MMAREKMQAMVLHEPHHPLVLERRPIPEPGPDQILIKVDACGVCRTDLHVVDGELPDACLPIVPGHEIVGKVIAAGERAQKFQTGDRVGVPWLAWACGDCDYCRNGRENLCAGARFTGYHVDGGYAEFTLADHRYALRIQHDADAAEFAPLLCAGLIGYRSLRMAGDARRLGLYGFGAAAHIVAQIAVHEGREIYAFTRPGDQAAQTFATELGAIWAGDADASPPDELDAAIIYAPVGELVPAALRAVARGGTVVCAGIHMSDIPSFPYSILWGERRIQSVANLTRRDGEEFMALTARVPIHTSIEVHPLAKANEALGRLRDGELKGAAVLVMA